MANPKWYGFNVLWLFSAGWKDLSVNPGCVHIDENDLDFIAGMGCNFIRLPVDYRFFIHNFDYENFDEEMLCVLDRCVSSIINRGLHCSLNIHRAPGYCINGAELEKHNLWQDEIAQNAFVKIWTSLAERYKNYSSSQLSFDLLNEPPNPGQYGMTREIHENLIRRVASEIRKVSPGRQIVIDGLCGGHVAIPELADLGVVHSGRGYQPFQFTHAGAEWCKDRENWATPMWPDMKCDGRVWNRDALLEFYKPWKELADKGVPVHIGECGCYNKVDNRLALKWYEDFFSVLNELGFGFSLWNFRGPFGIAEHRRENTNWEYKNGITFDKDLFNLFVNAMKL